MTSLCTLCNDNDNNNNNNNNNNNVKPYTQVCSFRRVDVILPFFFSLSSVKETFVGISFFLFAFCFFASLSLRCSPNNRHFLEQFLHSSSSSSSSSSAQYLESLYAQKSPGANTGANVVTQRSEIRSADGLAQTSGIVGKKCHGIWRRRGRRAR